ncbi:MAG: hypothetical protein ACLQVG_31630 [Terriglobia bacterium]
MPKHQKLVKLHCGKWVRVDLAESFEYVIVPLLGQPVPDASGRHREESEVLKNLGF